MRALVSCLVLTAFAVTACTSGGDDEAPPAPSFAPAAAPAVGLSLLDGLASPLRVGVVVTGTGARGEGTDVAAPAAGARVAEFRLDRSGTNRMDLDVVDDGGTAEGAVAATERLVAGGVAGIVYASAGAHLDGALQVAAAGQTAVLLPYETRPVAAGTTWHTGPSEDQVADQVAALLADRGQRAPLVLSGEGTGGPLAELADPARRATLTAGDALATDVATAAAALTGGTADALVVSASAGTSAEAVAAVQGLLPSVPVVLGPAALAPAFADRLTELGAAGGATTAGQFLAVGPAVADTDSSPAVVDFLAALRLAAQDTALPALTGAGSFADGSAATADTASHDAVLSLAAAASAAGSARPADVLAALRGLTADAGTGLAGPELTFGSAQALGDDGVGVLQATTRGSGRGVSAQAPALSWFVLPRAES